MSALPSALPGASRSLENAIRLPSADHAGVALRAWLPCVRFVWPEPSLFITKMSASLGATALRRLWNAIRPPAGENAGSVSSPAALVSCCGEANESFIVKISSPLVPARWLANAIGSGGSGLVSGGGGGGGGTASCTVIL